MVGANPQTSREFGDLLRRYREAAGCSQEELAVRSGLSARGISDLERGLRTKPRLETVRLLALGLELDAAELAEFLTARNANEDASWQALSRLPHPTTSFIGRRDELEIISALLTDSAARSITLVGPGGVGKTRIAIEIAHALQSQFPGGALFLNLAPVAHAGLVLPALADRLGIRNQADTDLLETVITALRNRPMLLILDNLEHLTPAAPILGELVARCPDLTILATSRVVLHLASERVVSIEPMDVDLATEFWPNSDALTLFVERACSADIEFVPMLDKDVAIVRKLEGLPLAIELAAARARHMSRTDLLVQLEDQLPVLTGGAVDGPSRHRTIRHTIAWSYDLLSSDAQSALRWLSLFPAGVTLATMRALFGDAQALAVMTELIDSSLLRRRDGFEGQARYFMLQTVRDFGLEQLAFCGDETHARSVIHERWCLPLARDAETQISQPDAPSGFRRILAEHQNLLAHIDWLIARERIDNALLVSGALAPWRHNCGKYDEGRRELETLLDHPRGRTDTVGRLSSLIGLGLFRVYQADVAESLAVLQEAISLALALSERRYLSMALVAQGTALWTAGDIHGAERQTQAGLAVAQELGDTFLIASSIGNLGRYAIARQAWDQARTLCQESLELFTDIDNVWGMAVAELRMARVMMALNELNAAELSVLSAQVHMGRLGDRRDLAESYRLLATISIRRGQQAVAVTCLTSALEIAYELGDKWDIAHCLLELGRLSSDRNEAVDYFKQALSWFERCHDQASIRECSESIARLEHI